MTGILDRIRNTTVLDLANVRSDFDDDRVYAFQSRTPKDMVRIVKGATDLQRSAIPNLNPGMVKMEDWSGADNFAHDGEYCDDPRCCPEAGHMADARSPRQIELMRDLHMQLAELDHDIAEKAVEYTTNMTLHGAWTSGREGNASRWIGNMIKKVRELRANPPKAEPVSEDDFADIPAGRYAVQDSGPGDWIFVRVTEWKGRRFVKIQASDELHPVRNPGRRKAILTSIRAMTPQESMLAYGRLIGRCGHCGRTLTNAESRAAGIGPKCQAKMGW